MAPWELEIHQPRAPWDGRMAGPSSLICWFCDVFCFPEWGKSTTWRIYRILGIIRCFFWVPSANPSHRQWIRIVLIFQIACWILIFRRVNGTPENSKKMLLPAPCLLKILCFAAYKLLILATWVCLKLGYQKPDRMHEAEHTTRKTLLWDNLVHQSCYPTYHCRLWTEKCGVWSGEL